MPKCTRCGKRGLFLQVNNRGHCEQCIAEIKEERRRQDEAQAVSVPIPEPVPVPEPPKTVYVPSTKDGHKMAYHYDHVKIFSPDELDISHVLPGDSVDFVPEPDNAYDARAIRVMRSGDFIGYIRKGTIQDMIHDWLSRDLPYISHVSSIEYDEHEVKVFLAFYRSRPTQPVDVLKLTGNRNKGMQEIISACHEDEEVEAYYEPEKDKYLALCGGEIGYFPKSVEKYVDEEALFFIERVVEDDNGVYSVFVRVEQ